MGCTITQLALDDLVACSEDPQCPLEWNLVFVLPAWLKLWWQEFKPEAEPYVGIVKSDGNTIGLAALRIQDGTASFIGSVDVCDYLDFVIVPGAEKEFFEALLDDLKQRNVRRLDLSCLRPESTVLTHLAGIARQRGYEVACKPEDVSVELSLPTTFDKYLETLETKQRHEVKRKLRRLLEAGRVNYRIVEDSAEVRTTMDTFLRMFTDSRSDKAAFLTSQKESFFRALADTMSGIKLLKMGVLELDGLPTAMILYFDFKGGAYLYNSGYDPRYDSLSVGLMSKVLCIEECINSGRRKYDFLKGNETYKYRLGGKEVTLSNCQIALK